MDVIIHGIWILFCHHTRPIDVMIRISLSHDTRSMDVMIRISLYHDTRSMDIMLDYAVFGSYFTSLYSPENLLTLFIFL